MNKPHNKCKCVPFGKDVIDTSYCDIHGRNPSQGEKVNGAGSQGSTDQNIYGSAGGSKPIESWEEGEIQKNGLIGKLAGVIKYDK